MSDGLNVGILSEEEVRSWVHDKEHCVFVFGRDAYHLIDELDAMINHYPSFPTSLFPIAMTVVPKSALPREKLTAWLRELGARALSGNEDSGDLFFLTNDQGEGDYLVSAFVARFR